MEFSHFIISQFNVNVNRGPHKVHTWPKTKAWCESRFNTLKNFTYPSVMNQTNRNFEWLIFLDRKNTDANIAKEFENLKNITIIYIENQEPFNKDHIIRYLVSHKKLKDKLITSGLDSDDCIQKNYIEEIQKLVDSSQSTFYIEPYDGLRYQLNNQIYWDVTWPNNPFLSVVEPVNKYHNLKTCKFTYYHYNVAKAIGLDKKVRVQFDQPLWLQILHNDNIASFIDTESKLKRQDSKFNRIDIPPDTIKDWFNIEF